MKVRQDRLETLDQHFDRFGIEIFLFQEFENRHRACPQVGIFRSRCRGAKDWSKSPLQLHMAALHNFPGQESFLSLHAWNRNFCAA
jgi:hypothetical protein